MAMLDLWPINTHLPTPGLLHSFVVSLCILSPFPFYWYLWTNPKKWMKMCGPIDPSHRMAQVAHILKAFQVISLVSVATFSVPPLICVALFAFGQFLNYRYHYFSQSSMLFPSMSLHALDQSMYRAIKEFLTVLWQGL